MPKEKLQKEVSSGYFIDEEGLYYYHEYNGEIEDFFSINGVASITHLYSEINTLHLAYIYDE